MKNTGAFSRIAALLFGVMALACGGGGNTSGNADGGARADGGAQAVPAEKCAASFTGTGPKFRDVTETYGFADVRGGRVSVGDLDNDGYPDVIVHTGGSHNRADFTKAKKLWTYRVMMSRPKDGGGRTFVDRTLESGYSALRGDAQANVGRAAHFAIYADLNDDGFTDIYSGTYSDRDHPETDPGDRSTVLLGDGNGNFFHAGLSQAVEGEASRQMPSTGATFLDDDKDGLLDVYQGYWYRSYGSSLDGVQNRLIKGVGDGTFEDVTIGAGLTTPGRAADRSDRARPTYGVTACDVDGDGDTDLLVSAYGRSWNQLWLRGPSEFRDVGPASGFAGDGLLDYADNEFYKCHCQLSGACTAGAPRISCDTDYWSSFDAQPFRLNGNSFTTACGDVDGDGKMDLITAEIAHWHIGASSDKTEILRNEGTDGGVPTFTRPGKAATGFSLPRVGTSWNEGGISVAIADVDNDGRADILVGTSDYPDNYLVLFHQQADGKFKEVSQAAGVRHACAPAFALADLDRDGDLDLVVTASTARDCRTSYPDGPTVKVYENLAGQDANWTQLELVGAGHAAGGANKSAIGARVTVTANGKSQTKELQGGYGHFGLQHDLHMTFGLGGDCQIQRIEVRWPDLAKTVSTFDNVRANYRIKIEQGRGLSYKTP